MDIEVNGEEDVLEMFDEAIEDADSGVEYEVRNGKHYGPYVEYGTSPHPITPDSAEALAFPGAGGGIVFAQRVQHPGTDPQPFWRPGYDATEAQLQRIEAQTDSLAEYQRTVARTLYREVTIRTPVDTGDLRNAWELNVL